MRLIIDFSSAGNPDGEMRVIPRRQLVAAALAALAGAMVIVYLLAGSVAAYWLHSGADIAQEAVKKHIRASNQDRERLWQESVGILKRDIAALNARVLLLQQKGATLSDYIGLPSDNVFNLSAAADSDMLCAADDASAALTVEERQIQLSGILHRQSMRVDEIERGYDLLRDHGIHSMVLKKTLPIERPLLGKHWVSSRYGYRRDPFTGKRAFHAGDDYAARRGTPVVAAADGIAIYTGRLGNYGNAIHLYHGSDISTLYGHLHKIHIKTWDYVSQGDIIGTVGSTGRSTGPHLHYEVRIKNRPRSVIRSIRELRKQRDLSS